MTRSHCFRDASRRTSISAACTHSHSSSHSSLMAADPPSASPATAVAAALTNSLGIPAATFPEDVDQYMREQAADVTAGVVIKRLDEQHSKYRFMEMNLVGKKKRINRQIPDIKASLDVLRLIRARKERNEEMRTNFLLSDEVHMEARIAPTDRVNLWLGANVMLEYGVDEAEQLLTRNLLTAEKNLQQVSVDLDYLRDQITTTEVNMARVYNWDVKKRQSEKKD